MTENNQKENLVLVGAKVKQATKDIIENIAEKEDRSVSRIVSRLLETHPEVQAMAALESQPIKLAA